MEYGFIVIKNNDYSNLFFIHTINDSSITLIPSYEPSKRIIDDKENYTIVYKPKLRGVCDLNNLNLNNNILLTYKDKEREGKIIKKKNDLIHIQFFKEPDKPVEVFDFNYKGIPSTLLSIKKLQTYKDKDTQMDKLNNDYVKEYVIESANEDTYYYSIEQQVNQLLEELTKNIDLNDNTQLNHINKIITHYIELNQKYYTYENNYIFKQLSDKSIYNTILKGDSIFEYYSNSENTRIYYYDDNTFVPKSFPKELIDKLFIDDMSKKIFRNSLFFYDTAQFLLNSNDNSIDSNYKINQINDTNLDNLSIENSKYKSTYNRNTYTNILLEDLIEGQLNITKYNPELYSIKTNNEFIIDGIVIPSISSLKTYMKHSKMNQLINKIHSPTYTKDKYILGTTIDEPCIFTDYNQIVKKNMKLHKNETEEKKEFYTFLNRIIPNIRYLLQCLNIKCYNIYDYIKVVSIFDIYELSKKNYDYINRLVQKNIRNYKKSTIVKKMESNSYSTLSFLLNSIITDSLKENGPNKNSTNMFVDNFYSSSELFKVSLYENHTLILFDIIKSNLGNKLDIKTSSIKEIIDEFKTNVNRDTTTSYDKIYNSMDEMDRDIKPIFKDVTLSNGSITNVSEEYVKSSTHIWNKVDKSKFKSFESFESALKAYVVSYKDPNLDTYKIMIKEWSPKNIITNGMLAYVIEKKKIFVYENNQWKNYIEADFVKGSSEYNSYINKRINEIVKDESSKQLYLSQEYSDRDYYIMKARYLNLFNQSVFYKYNQIKRVYSQLYISNGYKPSPYQPIFDKILMIENAADKKKYIKMFCELYTIEGKDPYWLYCIETSNKLVPLFIKKLAYSNNYNETIQEICYEQGTQQDEYWVDKYSGYTIKKINFNEEEGFTSDGFKVVSREVIQEQSHLYSENEKNIETILNSIGISNSYIKPIYIEYEKISKQLSKTSLLIYVVIFIYIQCYIDTNEVTKSFFSCKTSFNGYPLSKDESETSGIEYMICVYKALTNSKKTIDNSLFIQLIKNALKFSSKMTYQLTVDKKTFSGSIQYANWPLFLPRLNTINLTKIHNDYYKNFYFQQKMNKWIDKIEPTLTTSNGLYKIINNYEEDDSIKEIRRKYEKRIKYNMANLYYYREVTKNNNKYNISKPTYSLNKIDRILNPKYNSDITDEELKEKYTEINDELLKEVIKKLHKNKKMNHETNSTKKKEIESSITDIDIKTYQSIITDYLSVNTELKLNKLFNKLSYVSKKRDSILTSKDEHDKMVHNILFNLLNEIIIISMIKDKTTYIKPNIRKYLIRILKQSDHDKLLNIISNTYIIDNSEFVISEEIIQNMKLTLNFNLKDQIIIYKYYLCIIYKNSNKKQRKLYETIIQTLTKSLVIKVDIIKKNNEQAKYKEKKEITDKFKELSQESRNVEFLLKQNKLGDWSLGLSTSIYKYDGSQDIVDDPNMETTEKYNMDPIEEITEYEDYMGDEE